MIVSWSSVACMGAVPHSCTGSRACEAAGIKVKILQHLSSHNLLPDQQCRFYKGQSAGNVTVILTESGHRLRSFSENFAVVLGIIS